MERTLSRLVEAVENKNITKSNDDGGDVINGISIMRLPSRDAYSFGLILLDIMFTKEELGSSLFFSSTKSSKPGLEKERVNSLLKYIEKRYPTNWNLKTLTGKINQKCRDSTRKEKQ